MFKYKNKHSYKLVGSLNRVPLNVSYLSDRPNFQLKSNKIDIKWNKCCFVFFIYNGMIFGVI